MKQDVRKRAIQALLSCAMVAAAVPAVAEPVQRLKPRVERPTEVMVLATDHLTRIQGLEPGHLDGLHEALRNFAPNAIVVETLDARVIEAMLSRPEDYREAIANYVGTEFIQQSEDSRRHLDADAGHARRMLETCMPLPVEAEDALVRCLHLAAAAYDLAWFDYMGHRYREHYRRPAPLEWKHNPSNERYLIAGRLGVALDLGRIHAMDDHLNHDDLASLMPALTPALEASEAVAQFMASSVTVVEGKRRSEAGLKQGNLLPYFLWMNSPAYSRQEWRLFVDRGLPHDLSLKRLALWDVRNLSMTSNIMRVAAKYPGQRLLVIVGASHKVFFDAYLADSISVRVRQLEEFVP